MCILAYREYQRKKGRERYQKKSKEILEGKKRRYRKDLAYSRAKNRERYHDVTSGRREKQISRQRNKYREDPEKYRAQKRESDEKYREKRRNKGRKYRQQEKEYLKLRVKNKPEINNPRTGMFSKEEDRIIISNHGSITLFELCFILNRNYGSVMSRKHKLKMKGLI